MKVNLRPVQYGLFYLIPATLMIIYGCSADQQSVELDIIDVPEINISHSFDIRDSDETMMSFIGQVHITSDDHILIAEGGGQQNHVHHFDETGNYVQTFMETGSGPGEVEMMSGTILTPDDRFIVFDMGNRRFSIFNRSGNDWQFTDSFPYEENVRGIYPVGENWLLNRMPDLFSEEPDSIYLDLIDGEGNMIEEGALIFPPDQSIQLESEQGMVFMEMYPSFMARNNFDFGDDYLIHAYTDRLKLNIYDLSSLDKINSFSMDLPELTLSDERREEFIREQTEREYPGDIDPVRQIEQQLPDNKTPLIHFFYDAANNYIWANIYHEDETPWLIFNRSGDLLYSVNPDFSYEDIRTIHNGRLFIAGEDENGLPKLQVYEYEG